MLDLLVNWEVSGKKDASAGSRFSAPGSKKVLLLDLGSSWDIYNRRFSFVCGSSQSSAWRSRGTSHIGKKAILLDPTLIMTSVLFADTVISVDMSLCGIKEIIVLFFPSHFSDFLSLRMHLLANIVLVWNFVALLIHWSHEVIWFLYMMKWLLGFENWILFSSYRLKNGKVGIVKIRILFLHFVTFCDWCHLICRLTNEWVSEDLISCS